MRLWSEVASSCLTAVHHLQSQNQLLDWALRMLQICDVCLIFNMLSTDLSTGLCYCKGGVSWSTDLILEQNCALRRATSNGNSDQGRAILLLAGRECANIRMAKLDLTIGALGI